MNEENKKIQELSTGKYLVIGKGFVADCYWEASDFHFVSADMLTEVLGSNYGSINSVNEFECGCDECNKEE